MTLPFRSWAQASFVLAVLILGLLGAVSYRNTNELARSRDRVARTYEVLARIEGMRSELDTLQSAEHDFLASGEDRHLEPHYVAARVINQSVAELRRLLADNPTQHDKVRALEALVATAQAESAARVRSRKDRGQVQAEEAASNAGPGKLEAIRRLLDDLKQEENDRLRERQAEADATARVTRVTLIGGHLLVLLVVGWAGLAMYQESARRERAEQAQRWTQARLSAIIESATEAIISVDADQHVLLFNEAAEQMFRCAAAEVIGRPLDRFIPERFRRAHREHMRRLGATDLIRRRMGVPGATWGLRADGEEFPIEASISQVTVAGQRICTVILRDVSERRQAEQRLQEQAALLNQVPDAILVRDFEDRIVYWNRGAERLYGWKAEEVLGRNIDAWLFRDPGEGLQEARQVVVEKGEWAGEVRQLTRDGRDVIAEARWILVRDDNGRARAKLVVNTDITARKKLEAQLLRSQRLESIGVLAGGVAHDFNNLLTPILMAVKLLQKDRPEEERRNLLATLQASAERGSEMVKQLLSFAGGLDGHLAPIQLGGVINEVKALLDHTLPRSIDVQVAVARDLWPVLGDATQLSQVLMNLSINARDAMPEGGMLTIQAENTVLDPDGVGMHPDARPGPHVLVTVADTGTGIAADVIDRIFDPFFTTKEHGKGTGLGLSTALGIIRSHGGFINLSSEVGQGTRFTLYLPAHTTEEAPPRSPTRQRGNPPGPGTAELPAGHGEVILVVDDESFIRDTARATLEAYGYRVLTAGDGQEALGLYRQHRSEIKAVLLDMMMPVLDGPAAVAALRELDPRVRIIATSGLGATGRVAEAVAAGAKAFLKKPYTDEQLLRVVAEVLLPRVAE